MSISYVAIENIFQRRSTLLVFNIFIFGLIHGLGFAFVWGDIKLNTSQLVLSLISFNIGVEIASSTIILASIIFIYLHVRVGIEHVNSISDYNFNDWFILVY